jgi:hypothetical protein
LIRNGRPGINSPLEILDDEERELRQPLRVYPDLRIWVRLSLIAIALGVVGVFAIAIALDPYQGGKTWSHGTHQQLGLLPCNFLVATGYPCPSCGMTTSFAFFTRGDIWHSMQANFVGTFLALLCLGYIPWSIASAWRGRPLFMVSMEMMFLRLVIAFLILMLLRWGVVVLIQALS